MAVTSRRFVFTATYRLSKYGIADYLAALERSQWLSRPEISDLQGRKLAKLIQHAYESVPYYRDLMMESGLTPSDFKTIDDIKMMPIVTKADIQANRQKLVSDNVRTTHLVENQTGGSTGHPLRFYQDRTYRGYAYADIHRNLEWTGFRPGDRHAYLWGSDYDSVAYKGWRGVARRVLQGRMWINVFNITQESLSKWVQRLVGFQPEFIIGYASSLVMLAKFVREYGVRDLRPVALQSSAEILSPEHRGLLESAFGCSVFDRYGCREVGNIAHECSEHGGLHINAENNLVEFVDGTGNPVAEDQAGRIIVTNLNNYGMPFIRYDTDDVGVPSGTVQCKCGRGLPMMSSVKGRRVDIIVSPSGKLLHGEFFTHLFYKLSGVTQFQVVQEDRQNLTISIVPGPDFSAEESTKWLRDMIHRHGDPRFCLQFRLCDGIEPSRSGKHRFTVSKVPVDFGLRSA